MRGWAERACLEGDLSHKIARAVKDAQRETTLETKEIRNTVNKVLKDESELLTRIVALPKTLEQEEERIKEERDRA